MRNTKSKDTRLVENSKVYVFKIKLYVHVGIHHIIFYYICCQDWCTFTSSRWDFVYQCWTPLLPPPANSFSQHLSSCHHRKYVPLKWCFLNCIVQNSSLNYKAQIMKLINFQAPIPTKVLDILQHFVPDNRRAPLPSSTYTSVLLSLNSQTHLVIFCLVTYLHNKLQPIIISAILWP